jgi:hypothetical protein
MVSDLAGSCCFGLFGATLRGSTRTQKASEAF